MKEQGGKRCVFPPYGLFLERSQKAGQMGRLMIMEFLNLPQSPFCKVGALKEMSLISPPLGKGEEEHSGFFTSHSPAELGNAPISPSSAWAPLPLLHPRWHKCPAWARRRGKARCRRLKNRLSRFPACASFSSPHTEGAAASGLPPPRFPPLALPGI